MTPISSSHNFNSVAPTAPDTNGKLVTRNDLGFISDVLKDSLPIPGTQTSPKAYRSLNSSNKVPASLIPQEFKDESAMLKSIVDNLKEGQQQSKYHEKLKKGVKWVKDLYKDAIDGNKDDIKEVLEFLSDVLPESFDYEGMNEQLESSYFIFDTAETFLKACDCTCTAIAINQKAKILAESEKKIKNLKEHYALKKPDAPIPAIILKWEKKIALELQKLEKTFNDQKKKQIKGWFSLLKIPLKLIPLGEVKGTVLTCLGTGLKLLGWDIEHDKVKKSETFVEKYKVIVRNFNQWQLNVQAEEDLLEKQGLAAFEFLNPSEDISVKIQDSPIKKRDYEKDFLKIINKCESIEDIRVFLMALSFPSPHVPSSQQFIEDIRAFLMTLDSPQQFKDFWNYQNFKLPILNSYIQNEELIDKIQHIIDTSDNLLEKREAILEKKILDLRSRMEEVLPDLMKLHRVEFDKKIKMLLDGISLDNISIPTIQAKLQALGLELPSGMDTEGEVIPYLSKLKSDAKCIENLFDHWFLKQPLDSLLKSYIFHQENMELHIRKTLRNMVSKKHEMEKGFIEFNAFKAKIEFVLTTISGILMLLEMGLFKAKLQFLFSILYRLTAILNRFYIFQALASFSPLMGVASTFAYTGYKYREFFASIGLRMAIFGLNLVHRKNSVGFDSFYGFTAYCEKGLLNYHKFLLIRATCSKIDKEKKLGDINAEIKRLKQKREDDQKQLEENCDIPLTKKEEWEREKNRLKQAQDEETQIKIHEHVLKQFETSEQEERRLERSVEELKISFLERSWKDFAQYASLEADALSSIEEVINGSDFNLFDENTKTLFEEHLGIGIADLLSKKKQDPSATRRAIQTFFALTETKLSAFIEERANETD